MKDGSSIDMVTIVDRIKEIMDKHAPIEVMYNDTLELIETDIPLNSCTPRWKFWLEKHGMSYENFICNTLMAVLSEICADVSTNDGTPYKLAERRKVDLRQRKIIKLKEKVYGEELYAEQPYFETVKQKNLSGLFHKELLLVLHEFVNASEEEGKSINPILKLTGSQNINLEHFSSIELEGIIEYYKDICRYIFADSEIKTFERMMIIYHLEIETRFSTIFQILKLIKTKIKQEEKEALYHLRGICSRNIMQPSGDLCRYQNIIYLGKRYYIEKLASCFRVRDFNDVDEILKSMYEIVSAIYVIRDTIMTDLKRKSEECYKKFVDVTYNNFVHRMTMKGHLSEYEDQILQEMEILKEEYRSFEYHDVKVDHFIRMYVSDDKLEAFKASENRKRG